MTATVTPIRPTGYLVGRSQVPPKDVPTGWVVVETWSMTRHEDWESSYWVGPVLRESAASITIEVDGEPLAFAKTGRVEVRGPVR